MATNQLRRVIQTLRRASLPHADEGLSDGQLLESYVRSQEEAAFAALVRRHGPMVWGVCRRVLRSHHDAEDAFQATFLVLIRKAGSVVKLANWLYGVAHQTALYARATAAKREAREKQVTTMPEPARQQELWNDLQNPLDQELSGLPDKYREVIVVCDLEGKTRKEAARHFSLPEGTVASRLATARTMLAKRLARHGAAMSGAALAVVLAQNSAAASVPVTVVSNTIKAATLFAAAQAAAPGVLSVKAVALAEGVLKTMLLTKLKIATAVLVAVTVLGVGAAALTHQVLAGKAADQPAKEESADQPAKEKKEGKNPIRVVGVVKAVDAEKNNLTVAHQEGETTFTVARDAAVTIDDRPGTLAGVPAGAEVSLDQFADQRTARRVQANGSLVGGLVKAVDVEKNTFTFDDERANPSVRGKTMTLAPDANIVIEDRKGQLAGLVGAHVQVALKVDQKTARGVLAWGPEYYGVPVKAVDADKNTITDDKARTYAVAKDASIGIDGKPGKLADLPPGAYVNLLLSVDQMTVRRVQAVGAELYGVPVKAVDADKNTITDDKDRTYAVANDARIDIDGKSGKLADLPAGARVYLALTVDQKTARRIQADGGELYGIPVKAVDPDKHTITDSNNDRTYAVARDAPVSIEGKPGKLMDVPPGAWVNLFLSVDQKTALRLQVEGPYLSDVLKAVDADKNTITDSGDRTYAVAKDAAVVIDGKPGKLAELREGATLMLRFSVDQKTVRKVEAKGP